MCNMIKLKAKMYGWSVYDLSDNVTWKTKNVEPFDVNKLGLHCTYRPANASTTRSICCVSLGSPTSISSLRSATSRGSSMKSNCPMYVRRAWTWKVSALSGRKIEGKREKRYQTRHTSTLECPLFQLCLQQL